MDDVTAKMGNKNMVAAIPNHEQTMVDLSDVGSIVSSIDVVNSQTEVFDLFAIGQLRLEEIMTSKTGTSIPTEVSRTILTEASHTVHTVDQMNL
uniref:Uncharacterized protein n=1 Tax=Acrobeloides nanus TaxID=290746 RepID=A0A914CWG4_9BILA